MNRIVATLQKSEDLKELAKNCEEASNALLENEPSLTLDQKQAIKNF